MEVSCQIPFQTVNKINITFRLGRPCTILITAGSSNICPLPSPPLCPLPLPRCPGRARGTYCGLCLGGDGELWWDGGLGSGGGGGSGVGGDRGGSPNWRRPLLGSSVVPCVSRSTIQIQSLQVAFTFSHCVENLSCYAAEIWFCSIKSWTEFNLISPLYSLNVLLKKNIFVSQMFLFISASWSLCLFNRPRIRTRCLFIFVS